MNTSLVVMAAGIGSRFGKGIKQLEPVGPCGEVIMDYSVNDAIEAGFDRVVFIIRKDLENVFREMVGDRISKKIETAYVYQDMNNLPDGFTCPADRIKPWGTGQAVLCCKDSISGPFLVINADDYYGKTVFRSIHEELSHIKAGSGDMCMAGFVLGNTLSENGGVTRGVCKVDDDGYLVDISETANIVRTQSGAATESDGKLIPIPADVPVSMNAWGFTPDIFPALEKGFVEFLKNIKDGDVKSEYLLPDVVDNLIKSGKGRVKVLSTPDIWFGVTYHEDKKFVSDAFKKFADEGLYKSPLAD